MSTPGTIQAAKSSATAAIRQVRSTRHGLNAGCSAVHVGPAGDLLGRVCRQAFRRFAALRSLRASDCSAAFSFAPT